MLAWQVGKIPGPYLVPRFLLDGGLATDLVDAGDPCRYFLSVIDKIAGQRPDTPPADGLGDKDLVYLIFMRTFASLNGQIGTPLKQLAFLPHLRTRLGVSVLLSLPTAEMGSANRKGERGSPFAVRNPFGVDHSLGDPLAVELPAVRLYQALSEACAHLGMRLGSIVPLATLAIDSPLFRYFPELGHWWLARPDERLHAAHAVYWSPAGGYSPPPIEAAAAGRFRAAPPRDAVVPAMTRCGIFYCAQAPDGQTLTLANAFPDVLPADAATYTWEDVSPVRYGSALAPGPAGVRPAKTTGDLVQTAILVMAAAIAWRYCELGERILVVDVAPSVPDAVLETARLMCAAWPQGLGGRLRALGSGESSGAAADRLLAELADLIRPQCPGRLVTDLHFVAEELWSFTIPSASYSAITGPITPCVSAHSRQPAVFRESLRYHLAALAAETAPVRHLPGVSNHDTNPPVLAMSRRMLLFYSFLPGCTPLIFSGSEWGFEVIVNREFGFSSGTRRGDDPDRADLPALFNDYNCPWGTLDRTIPPLHDLRQWILGKLRDYDINQEWIYRPLDGPPPDCLGYLRISPDNTTVLAVVWNFAAEPRHAGLCLDTADMISWPPYVTPAEPEELAMIPPGAVAVLIGASDARASFSTGGAG